MESIVQFKGELMVIWSQGWLVVLTLRGKDFGGLLFFFGEAMIHVKGIHVKGISSTVKRVYLLGLGQEVLGMSLDLLRGNNGNPISGVVGTLRLCLGRFCKTFEEGQVNL